ncbi:MAG TPA: DUF6356 family protein [Myxococcota bacterium]|nr:DUF6356 family protein [Myxococcota bacterium]
MTRAASAAGAFVDELFLAHPRSVGESYPEHLAAALGFAALLGLAAAACFVHALVPALFTRSASRRVAELNTRMVRNRQRLAALGAEPDWAI